MNTPVLYFLVYFITGLTNDVVTHQRNKPMVPINNGGSTKRLLFSTAFQILF